MGSVKKISNIDHRFNAVVACFIVLIWNIVVVVIYLLLLIDLHLSSFCIFFIIPFNFSCVIWLNQCCRIGYKWCSDVRFNWSNVPYCVSQAWCGAMYITDEIHYIYTAMQICNLICARWKEIYMQLNNNY